MPDLPNTVHAGAGFAREEFLVWRPGRDGEPFRTCGYCGSMHPEDFAAATIAAGGRCEMADWKYGWPHKTYIDVANPDPDRIYVMGRATIASDSYRAWVDLTEAEREIVRASAHPTERPPDEPDTFGRLPGFAFGKRPSLFAKFYTVHLLEPSLSDEIKDRCFARIGLVIEPGVKPGSVRWSPYDYGKAA